MQKFKNFWYNITGIVIVPMVGIIVCSFLNVVLALIFGTTFTALQHSPIWVLHFFIIAIAMVSYFLCAYPTNAKSN